MIKKLQFGLIRKWVKKFPLRSPRLISILKNIHAVQHIENKPERKMPVKMRASIWADRWPWMTVWKKKYIYIPSTQLLSTDALVTSRVWLDNSSNALQSIYQYNFFFSVALQFATHQKTPLIKLQWQTHDIPNIHPQQM